MSSWYSLARWFGSRAPLGSRYFAGAADPAVTGRTRGGYSFQGREWVPRPYRRAAQSAAVNNDDDDDDDDGGGVFGGDGEGDLGMDFEGGGDWEGDLEVDFGGGEEEEEEEEDVAPAPAAPAAPAFVDGAQVVGIMGRRLDSDRLQHGKQTAYYQPQVTAGWWYQSPASFDAMEQKEKKERSRWSHAGRMLETVAGELKEGDAACERCRRYGLECWVYAADAVYHFGNPGEACARCRTDKHQPACSLVTKQRRHPRPPPPPPSWHTHGPPPPPPGGGSIGAAVPVS